MAEIPFPSGPADQDVFFMKTLTLGSVELISVKLQ